MTQYIAQTNTTLLTEGELGVLNGSQLVVGTGTEGSYEVVGNPSGGASVDDLGYAFDGMDISSASTLGSGFIFLGGTTYDTMGVGTYEFEEANGIVYGLYGLTNGVQQRVFFSAAPNNQSQMQYTTVPYNPPFTAGSVWQPTAVIGSDLQGFTLLITDTSEASTAFRYLYVKHNGSLINTAGHQYIEITSMVNTYMGYYSMSAGIVPKIVHVGGYFVINTADWLTHSCYVGIWNDNFGSYTYSNATVPSSAAAYSATQCQITTTNLIGGDITPSGSGGAAYFPNTININTQYSSTWNLINPSGYTNHGQPTVNNSPEPLVSGWTTNMTSMVEGETDSSGNAYLALGHAEIVESSDGSGAWMFNVQSCKVIFSGGSASAYTNANLVFVTPSSGGDLYHMQPGPTYYYNMNISSKPDETVQSSDSTPSTCLSKLPDATYYLGGQSWIGAQVPTISYYYSGVVTCTCSGSSNIMRAISNPAGVQRGSLAAAKANKLANIYPMFNVTYRADFNQQTGSVFTRSISRPSGIQTSNYFGTMVGKDTMLMSVLDSNRNLTWAMSILPTGSNITDASYNRNGTIIPGFKPRVAEYPVNFTAPNGASNTWGSIFSVNNTSDMYNPITTIAPVITDASGYSYPTTINNGGIRIGHWTLSNGVYQPPPITMNYASTMTTDLQSLKSSVVSYMSGNSNYSGFGALTVGKIEISPVFNSTGTAVDHFIGILFGANSSNVSQAVIFTCAAIMNGSVVSINTGTPAIQMLTSSIYTFGTASQTHYANNSTTSNDTYGGAGKLFVLYNEPANTTYYQWTNAEGQLIIGDVDQFLTCYSNNNGSISFSTINRSASRCMTSCSVQHNGLAVFPVRDSDTVPEVDLPYARYSTSAVTSVASLATSFQAAISNISNQIPGSPISASYNLCEAMVLTAISNQFMLQLGAVYGRLNHKEFNFGVTYIDMTSYAIGQYYIYITDTGSGIQIQLDTAERPESSTNMYFGTVSKSAVGLFGMESVSDVIRFGTARLTKDYAGRANPGSTIRVGTYYQWEVYSKGLAAANVNPNVNVLRGFDSSGNPQSYGMGRSYNLVLFDANGNVTSSVVYDLFNSTTGTTNATNLVNALNGLATGQHFAIVTYDEPSANQTATGMASAFARVGATIFGSTTFQYRSAYILLGTVGSAAAYEKYVGVANSTNQNNNIVGDPNAFIGVAFSIHSGTWTVNAFNVGS